MPVTARSDLFKIAWRSGDIALRAARLFRTSSPFSTLLIRTLPYVTMYILGAVYHSYGAVVLAHAPSLSNIASDPLAPAMTVSDQPNSIALGRVIPTSIRLTFQGYSSKERANPMRIGQYLTSGKCRPRLGGQGANLSRSFGTKTTPSLSSCFIICAEGALMRVGG